ncbi:MAG: hypothetical protein KA397_05970 [Paludibacteraceae bacterium]|nr:hypothetical protein [Paludibacteraceae bacterium]MBP6284600.1 hypothetical protein [Paludibacteraceae bacterium]
MIENTPFLIGKIESHLSISQAFDQLPNTNEIHISCLNWEAEFPYLPNCRVHIGWNVTGLFLQFTIQEQQTLATHTSLHGTVCEDSCVEFFVSFDNLQSFFNFEFNAVGSMHVAHRACDGSYKHTLSDADLGRITVQSSLPLRHTVNIHNSDWTLNAHLPASLFNNPNWNKQEIWGNFYKCGNKLDVPHYVSWKAIEYEKPNFHLPQFFGKLVCQP